MSDFIFDTLRENLGLGFDWTAGTISAVLFAQNTWVPDEADASIAAILAAGAVEISGSTGDRQDLASRAVSVVAHRTVWDADAIVYPGVANGDDFDALVVYLNTGNDATSYPMGFFGLAGIGTGANLTFNPNISGLFTW